MWKRNILNHHCKTTFNRTAKWQTNNPKKICSTILSLLFLVRFLRAKETSCKDWKDYTAITEPTKTAVISLSALKGQRGGKITSAFWPMSTFLFTGLQVKIGVYCMTFPYVPASSISGPTIPINPSYHKHISMHTHTYRYTHALDTPADASLSHTAQVKMECGRRNSAKVLTNWTMSFRFSYTITPRDAP